MLAPWKKSYDQPRQHIKKQRHYFANKGPSSQSYGFSSGHVWIWELDYKESWTPKNWCFWAVVLEKTLESPLDCKEIQAVHPKGNQSWKFIGRTDAEAETPILGPPDANNCLIWKDPDAGKDWRREEEGMTKDEMAGWHHWLNGHESEQAQGVGDGQGGLVCCSPWGFKELDTTKQLNWVQWSKYFGRYGYFKGSEEGLWQTSCGGTSVKCWQIKTLHPGQRKGLLSCLPFSAFLFLWALSWHRAGLCSRTEKCRVWIR